MFWIEGISRSPSGFALDTFLADGTRSQHPLTGLTSPQIVGRTVRKRITTDCRDWSSHSAKPFWEFSGIQGQSPRDAHTVFEVINDGKRFLIPASVLIAAMMRPIKVMQAFLFAPQGLDSFCVPVFDEVQPRVGLHLPRHKVFGNNARLSSGLLASYSWMHCFPSARAMWDSVYSGALSGLLDIALPRASITMTLHSVNWLDYQLVTDLVIMSLRANEQSFGFAGKHPHEIFFHDSASLDWKTGHHPTCTIPARGEEWLLSDREWSQISTSIHTSHRVKFDLRKIIDLILQKFGTGQSWQKLNFEGLNYPIVQATYQRMQKDGRWQTIESLLLASRGASNSCVAS